jgi:hypothetical protein
VSASGWITVQLPRLPDGAEGWVFVYRDGEPLRRLYRSHVPEPPDVPCRLYGMDDYTYCETHRQMVSTTKGNEPGPCSRFSAPAPERAKSKGER